MDSLNTLAAAPWRQAIGGTQYWLTPLTLSDWGTIERRLVEGRRNPIDVAKENLAGLADDEKRMLLDAALKQASRAGQATIGELLAYIATPPGMTLAFWLALVGRQPEITESQAGELLAMLDAEGIARLSTQLGGGTGAGDPSKK